MDLLSSDEETCELEFWNNWSPLDESSDKKQCKEKFKKKIVFKPPKIESVKSLVENFNFGNWVPPFSFLNAELRNSKSIITPNVKCIQEKKGALSTYKDHEIIRQTEKVLENRENHSNNIEWKMGANLDWGKRMLLNDVSKFNDGDLIWGVVNLGMFANIKLWVNEYGNISGLADGKISKFGCSEITYICITDTQLLRKMLCLSSAQWASLCEIVQETKATLKFDAFQNCDLSKKSHLEKLWFFLCKRRHFLAPQCMLVKICGAIRCMRRFQIISKLVVLDIRNNLEGSNL